jgi:hypothetical protein
MMPLSRLKFLDSDYEVAINTIAVDGTEFSSNKIPLGLAKSASVTLYVKGNNAGCSKDVIFKFAAFDSLRNKWDTKEFFSVSVAADGTNDVQKTIAIEPDAEAIKLLSVQNQETTADYTVDINVSMFLK